MSDSRGLLGAGELANVTPWRANHCEDYKATPIESPHSRNITEQPQQQQKNGLTPSPAQPRQARALR